jgi:hypothetical protein
MRPMIKHIVFTVALAGSLALAGTADAARPRPVQRADATPPTSSPTTPEPSAALIFAAGLIAVGWASRRDRR